MWTLLKESTVIYPVMAYFDKNGDLIRYRTGNDAMNNVEADFRELMGQSGVPMPTPKPPVSSVVTIHKQPVPVTIVTEDKATESISNSATASSGKLTYAWAKAASDETPPKTLFLTQKTDPVFKLGQLKEGTHYYFCILYVDGKEALRSDIAIIQVVKAEETSATKQEATSKQETETNKETTTMKKGINVISYPTKTSYVVGEEFDTSGAKIVNNTGDKINDITASILYYTSKTVQLTQGRPFTTAGTKVVELRQADGNVIGKYTITVSEKGTTAKNPFNDISEGSYYYKPVLWALQNGVTSGTSGQVLTFLWRSNNKPSASGTSRLAKQFSGQYYTDALAWADSTGLLTDTVANFAPNNPSPRSDIVTYLYRNAGSPDIE